MANEYFQTNNTPAPNSPAASSVMRFEFSTIAAAFDKLPVMAGNANQVVMVNAAAKALIPAGFQVSELAKQTGDKGALKFPAGFNSDRPLTPDEGWARYSLETKTPEFWNGLVWGPITGAQGIQGPQGPQGIAGAPGATGPMGPTGPQGLKGDTGSATAIVFSFSTKSPTQLPTNGIIPVDWDGVGRPTTPITVLVGQSVIYQGQTAANYAQDDLFTYTAVVGDEWINIGSVKGPKGDTGAQGIQGPQGLQGLQGPQGVDGQQGVEGPVGPQGVVGPQGTVGPQGLTGATGATGPAGPQGIQGPAGFQGVEGPQGEDGISTIIRGEFSLHVPTDLPVNGFIPADWEEVGDPAYQMQIGDSLHYTGVAGPTYDPGDVFVFVGTATGVAAGWTNIGNVRGPTGATGPQGVQGVAGVQGPAGTVGATGPVGPQGAIGLTGPQGGQGPTGPQGATGPQGPIGATGAQGPTGTTGAQGPKGDKGDAAGATIIVAEFSTRTPAELPINGYIPADWDGVGKPATAFQMAIGESLAYVGAPGVDYNTGDIFIFTNTGTTGWTNLGGVQGPKGDKGDTGDTGPKGDKGDTGAQGPIGATGATGPTGPQGVKGDTGAVGMTYRGDWNASTTYYATDSVVYNGSTWIANQTTTGTAPPAGGAFGLVAQAGATGATGPQGPTGATGPQGPTGPTGPQGPAGPSAASGITFTPAGDVQATNVQAAIQELDSEKVAKAGDTMSGPLTVQTVKISGSGNLGNIGTAAEDALQIDATAKMIKALAPYLLKGDIKEQNLASPGYVKFASGFIIQWGVATSVAGGNASFGYAIPFPALGLAFGTPANVANTGVCNVSNGLDQVTMRVFDLAGAGAANVTVFVVAIGY